MKKIGIAASAVLLIIISIYLIFSRFFNFTNFTITPKTAQIEVPSKEILFLGDIGSGDVNQTSVAQAIEKHCQNDACEAVFVLGDVIYEQGVKTINDPQFQSKFEVPYQNINLPFYIAFGNHDYLGCRDCYLAYSAKSTRWKMPDYYYSQLMGEDLEVFVINTEDFDAKQIDWLTKKLQESKASWKIVVGHRPIVSYEETKNLENWTGKDKLQEIVCTYADLYISGHAHVMERNTIANCPAMQVVSGGGGAHLRNFVSQNQSIFSSSTHGFVGLSYTKQKLAAEFIDISGKALHGFNLAKE